MQRALASAREQWSELVVARTFDERPPVRTLAIVQARIACKNSVQFLRFRVPGRSRALCHAQLYWP